MSVDGTPDEVPNGLALSALHHRLVNAAIFVPKGERFTSFFDQDEDLQIDRPHELTSIDHVLVSQGLAEQLDTVEIDHGLNPALGTDGFVSDHFPIVVRFDLEGPIQQSSRESPAPMPGPGMAGADFQ